VTPATGEPEVLTLLRGAGRAQLMVRALAASTNRLIAGSDCQVRGEGTDADALVELLVGLGGRVRVTGAEPVRLLRHQLRGRAVSTDAAVPASTSTVFCVDVDLDVRDIVASGQPLTVVVGGGAVRTHGGAPAARDLAVVDAGPAPDLASERERLAELGRGADAERALALELLR
jgi:hypothetical protein